MTDFMDDSPAHEGYDPTNVAVWAAGLAFLAVFWGSIAALVAYVVR